MAKMVRTLHGDFDTIIEQIVREVVNYNVSSTLEEVIDVTEDGYRCSVRVFERYSMMGGNRLGLHTVFLQAGDGPVKLIATSNGGSQAVFVKINHWGEDAFLADFDEMLRTLESRGVMRITA